MSKHFMNPNYDKYFISKYGVVVNTKTGRTLKQHDNGRGYKKVSLTIKGKPHQEYIHRLVAFLYIENPMKLDQVNHRDGIKGNNNYKNLEWCTNSQNQIHAHRAGLKKSGSGLWNAKFSDEQIKQIRGLKTKGMLQYKIAEKFGTTKGTISEILSGKRYSYVKSSTTP